MTSRAEAMRAELPDFRAKLDKLTAQNGGVPPAREARALALAETVAEWAAYIEAGHQLTPKQRAEIAAMAAEAQRL